MAYSIQKFEYPLYILVRIAYAQKSHLLAHDDVSSGGVRGLTFCLSLPIRSFFENVSGVNFQNLVVLVHICHIVHVYLCMSAQKNVNTCLVVLFRVIALLYLDIVYRIKLLKQLEEKKRCNRSNSSKFESNVIFDEHLTPLIVPLSTLV